MKGLEVGDTLVSKVSSYFRVGDRLVVTWFALKNVACYVVLDEPGYRHEYRIELPLDEARWDVDYTAGPDSEALDRVENQLLEGMFEQLKDVELVNPLHLKLVSDGRGEFPDGYKLTPSGVTHIRAVLLGLKL